MIARQNACITLKNYLNQMVALYINWKFEQNQLKWSANWYSANPLLFVLNVDDSTINH